MRGKKRDPIHDIYKVTIYSDEMVNELKDNIEKMQDLVIPKIKDVEDSSMHECIDKIEKVDEIIIQLCGKMDEISDWGKGVIEWINSYSEDV